MTLTIRYPLMRVVGGQMTWGPIRQLVQQREREQRPGLTTYRRVRQDIDLGITYMAPRWIAWLYRWLPDHVGLFTDEGKPAGKGWFCWSIAAPAWRIGYVGAAQSRGRAGSEYITVDVGGFTLYAGPRCCGRVMGKTRPGCDHRRRR